MGVDMVLNAKAFTFAQGSERYNSFLENRSYVFVI